MKQIAELIPIILFFITYRMDGGQISLAGFEYTFDGIYSATEVLIISTIAVTLLSRIITGKLEKRQLWMLLAICVFGGLTLVFRNNAFIMWKPTIVNWASAVLLIGTHLFTDKNIFERMLGSQLTLPKKIWARLSNLWVANFIIVGALNLFVAYNFSEEAWVNYKLISSIGFTLLVSLISAAIMAPHIKDQLQEKE
jgi:intracellular septation protein